MKLLFWASLFSSVKIGIIIPTLYSYVKELSKRREHCGYLKDGSFLFFLPCSIHSHLSVLLDEAKDTAIFKWQKHCNNWCIVVCTHETYPQTVEEKMDLIEWKHLRIFSETSSLSEFCNVLYISGQLKTSVDLEAYCTDQVPSHSVCSWLHICKSWIVFCVHHSHQHKRKDKVREVTRHSAEFFMSEIK